MYLRSKIELKTQGSHRTDAFHHATVNHLSPSATVSHREHDLISLAVVLVFMYRSILETFQLKTWSFEQFTEHQTHSPKLLPTLVHF